MRRILVNDFLTTIPGTTTFWHSLKEWFSMEFVGGDFSELGKNAQAVWSEDISFYIRNASYFPPFIVDSYMVSLLQDIFEDGPAKKMQEAVMKLSRVTVFNSDFTASHYPEQIDGRVIPLPVDASIFTPRNKMGLQQALSLPDGCVCWIGACQQAGYVKGWDIFLQIVRLNPDIPFVAIFKDPPPEYAPSNMRIYTRIPHDELVQVIGACRVGLCTSRTESQHLSGIEMGMCGLPMVAPATGVYWKREDMPGAICENTVGTLSDGIRRVRDSPGDPQKTHEYWKKDFSVEAVRSQWETIVQEIECSGQ